MDISISHSTQQLATAINGMDLNVVAEACLTLPQGQTDIHHHFGPNLYIRELIAPAGLLLVGYYQKTTHMNVFLKGKVAMLQDGEVKEMAAPQLFVSPPAQKCGVVLEDMVWLNVYSTSETDVDKLEEMFLDKNIGIDQYTQHQLDILADREDYKKVLQEIGITEEQIQIEVQRTDNLIDMPHGTYSWGVYPSPLHGRGIFATSSINKGELIGLAGRHNQRTPLGRFTNHSCKPNARLITQGLDVYLVAIKDIQGNLGGQLGHEVTLDYRCSPSARRN